MPGSVIAVHRSVGDSVKAGDPVVTLEAMKMEHVVAAPIVGRIMAVEVGTGEQVTRGQVLGSIGRDRQLR